MEKINDLTPPERLELIRHKNRPTVRDYIPMIFDEFIEMHGDRLYGDDEGFEKVFDYLGKVCGE